MPNDQAQNFLPDDMTTQEKLCHLKIDQDDLSFYAETFVQDRSRYWIKEIGGDWKEAKTGQGNSIRLSRNLIGGHLMRKYSVATYSPKISRYLCLAGTPASDLKEYIGKVVEWLQSPLIFFSMERQQITFCAHLAFAISTEKLSIITVAELDIRGLTRGPLTWSHFPVSGKFMRLPLGQNSVLLHPHTLEPLEKDVSSSIQFIKENLRRRRFEELFPGVKSNPYKE